MESKGRTFVIVLILLVLVISIYKSYQYWLASLEVPLKEIILDSDLTIESPSLPEGEEIPEKIIPEEEKVSEEEKEPEKPLLQSPQVFLSSYTLEQADTLLVKVKNNNKGISGTFGQEKLDFIKTNDGWVSIFGINVKKKPGKYNLTVNIGEEKFEKEITIIKRNFPITELAVTPELEKKGYTQPKIAENIAKKDNPSIGKVLKIYTPIPYFTRPFTYSLNKIEIVGAYGNIRKKEDIQLQHLGVDLDAEVGTPVYAANDGKVVFTEELINYGKTLIIDHGLGIYSLYLHLDRFNAKKGQKVKLDDIIAYTGNTGYSIAPHLHFSIKVNGSSVDPLRFIKTTREKW